MNLLSILVLTISKVCVAGVGRWESVIGAGADGCKLGVCRTLHSIRLLRASFACVPMIVPIISEDLITPGAPFCGQVPSEDL